MKTALPLLVLACVGLVLVAATRWLSPPGSASAADPQPAPAPERDQAASGEGDAPARISLVARAEPDPAGEPGPVAAPRAPGDPFPWLLRDPPRIDGPVIESSYANGQREFSGRQVLDASGAWVRDGPWTAWYENGQTCELGAYREGDEEGPWQWWYENGQRMAEGSWVDGRRVGPWTFWQEDGDLLLVCSYRDGEGDALWTLYHEGGWKWAEGFFVGGVAHGHWNVWRQDGSLDPERSGTYVEGAKVD